MMQFYAAKWFDAVGQLSGFWVAQSDGKLSQVWKVMPTAAEKALRESGRFQA